MDDRSDARAAGFGRLGRDVLRLAAIPRAPGDIRFLSGDSDLTTEAVERCLRELERADLVQRSERGLWSQTAGGSDALRQVNDWEVVVDDVFNLTGRPRPILVGRIRRGAVYTGDWFLVNGDRVGRVASVEFACGPKVPPDALSFSVDISLEPGNTLQRYEFPEPAGGVA